MNKQRAPEPLDFYIWTVEDVGLWLEQINLGGYRQIFEANGVNGEYLESLSMFTTEQILRFIRRCHMKWGDFITLCKELRSIKVACLKGDQEIRRPWWAPFLPLCQCFKTQPTIQSCFFENRTIMMFDKLSSKHPQNFPLKAPYCTPEF